MKTEQVVGREFSRLSRITEFPNSNLIYSKFLASFQHRIFLVVNKGWHLVRSSWAVCWSNVRSEVLGIVGISILLRKHVGVQYRRIIIEGLLRHLFTIGG